MSGAPEGYVRPDRTGPRDTHPSAESPSPGGDGLSQQMLVALNAAAAELHRGVESDDDLYRIVLRALVDLGLRGGIMRLDTSTQRLVVQDIAYPGRSSALTRVQERTGLSIVGYSFDVNRVRTYRQAIEERAPVYAGTSSHIIEQMLPASARPLLGLVLKAFGSRPTIVAPIVGKEGVLGTINASGDGLVATDAPAMMAFANHLAVAMDNVRLRNRGRSTEGRLLETSRELELLVELNRAVNRGDGLQDILSRVASETARRLDGHEASVYLTDEGGTTLELQGTPFSQEVVRSIEEVIGRAIPWRRFPCGPGTIHGEILGAAEPRLIDDPADIERMMREHTDEPVLQRLVPRLRRLLGIVSVIAVPLFSRGKAVGLLTMSGKIPFSTVELRRLDAISGPLTAALENRREQETRQEAFALLQTTIDGIGDPILVIDTDYRVRLMNLAAANRHGAEAAHTVPLTCYEVLHGEDEPCHASGGECPLQSIVRDGEPVQLVHTHRTAEGEDRLYEIAATPLRRRPDDDVIGMIEVTRDITDRKRLVEELYRARRLESLGLLAGGIAHDFNNLSTGIQGNIELAGGRLVGGENMGKRRLDQAMDGCRRATRLVRRLLAYSRVDTPNTRVFDVESLLRETAELILPTQEVAYRPIAVGDPWPAKADPDQIGQAFQNLLLNAVQAMPDGGTVVVEIENRPEGNEGRQRGPAVAVRIRDEGIGIPAENLDKLFDPFFTTRESGNGLGLAITYSIIRRNRGAVWLTSTPGEGTTAHVLLPVPEGTGIAAGPGSWRSVHDG